MIFLIRRQDEGWNRSSGEQEGRELFREHDRSKTPRHRPSFELVRRFGRGEHHVQLCQDATSAWQIERVAKKKI